MLEDRLNTSGGEEYERFTVLFRLEFVDSLFFLFGEGSHLHVVEEPFEFIFTILSQFAHVLA